MFNTRKKQGERAFYYITHDTELITLIYTTIKEVASKNDNTYAVLYNKANYKHVKEDTQEEERQLLEETRQTILKAERCDGFKITRDIESADALEENKMLYKTH